jgi:hypothetical protein
MTEDASQGGAEGTLPPFQLLCIALAAQVQSSLGLDPTGAGGSSERKLDLAQAKQGIDLLAMLEEKTKGNLDAGETQLLGAILTQLRMLYVERART